MKIEEPEAMKEFRVIRDKMNREIKDMSPEERRAFFHKKSEHFEQALGKELRRLVKVKTE